MAARKYNPGFLSDEEIVASFCVRTSEFESVVEMLRDCRESSNPHQIVIGPRGSGKTSLLLRIAAEIRRDASLSSHFFPVLFAEESYEVSTAGEFWLECLSCLAVQAPRREGGPDLGRSYEELRSISDDRTLGERCLGAVLDFSDREAKRLVLFVENLNTLFRDMTDPDAGWRLRKVLQTEPRIILLASATRRFDQIDHPDQALYDLFRVTSLRPLGTGECATLWQTVSGREARQETIRSLRILTGGNPRLVMVVARFGASLSFRALMSDLLDLVDDHTEYFRSHLEMLPAQERRVYLALADLWKPATAREIADRARLETSKCSAQLTRLSERAIVEVTGGTARRKQYYLTERMYNIYYLLRRPRGPHRMVESLIRFMESFYSPLELRDIGRSIARDAQHVSGDMRALHEIAFDKLLLLPALDQHRGALPAPAHQEIADIRDRMRLALNELNEASITLDLSVSASNNVSVDEGTSEEAAALELIERGKELRKKNRLQEALSVFDGVIDRCGESAQRHFLELTANALVRKGEVLHALGRPEEALATCDEVIRRYGENEAPEISERIAAALLNKGAALGALSRMEEALAANDDLVRRFGASNTPGVRAKVAYALSNKGITLGNMSRLQDALQASDELVHRFGASEEKDAVIAVAKTLCNKGAILERLNRVDEALATYDSLVSRYGASNDSALHEVVATSLLNKGVALGERSQPDDALATFDEVIRRFGTVEKPALRATVALAMSNKGYALSELNRTQEALAMYDEVVRTCGASETPGILEAVGKALLNKARILVDSNRPECALSVYADIESRFSAVDSTLLRETAATALCNEGITLGKLGRHEEAVVTYGQVIRRFGECKAPVLVELVAKSLLNKGLAFSALSRPTDALAAYDETVAHAGDVENNSIQTLAAHALVKKGLTLVDLNRTEEALRCYEEVIRRYGSSDDSALRGFVANSILNKGVALATMNRNTEAIGACDELVRRYGGSETPGILESVAKALVNKAGLLLAMTRPRDTVYECDEAIRRFSVRDAPELVHVVADAFYLKGGAMLELKRPVEALAAFAEVLKRVPEARRTAIPHLQAKALLGRGMAFDKLGRFREALAAYDEVATRFGESKDLSVRGSVVSALARKVPILDGESRSSDAYAVHEELVRRLGQDAPEFHELVERTVVDRASFELICGRNRSAIEAAGLALDRCRLESVESRLRAHIIRAKANIADGNTQASEPDIINTLTLLENVETVPKEHLHALMEFSVELGPRRLRELVEASRSAPVLLSLATALAQEEGLQPRVAREVEEVAADIRAELEKIREGATLRTTADRDANRTGNTARTSGIIIRDKLNRTLPIRHGAVRLGVVGTGERKSNSWKVWMEKNGEMYLAIREPNPGFKVSLHKRGKQHIKAGNEYWGQWHEPEFYAGPMVATSAKLIIPTWGMREDRMLSAEDREAWKGNEIEIDAPAEGKLLAVAVIVRAKGQALKQEGGKSETLALWRRPDGKEAHLIVSEEAERNFKEVVLKALTNEDILRALREAAESRDDVLDGKTPLTATLAGPANEGGNYFLCVSTTIGTREGERGKEYVPIVTGLPSSLS